MIFSKKGGTLVRVSIDPKRTMVFAVLFFSHYLKWPFNYTGQDVFLLEKLVLVWVCLEPNLVRVQLFTAVFLQYFLNFTY